MPVRRPCKARLVAAALNSRLLLKRAGAHGSSSCFSAASLQACSSLSPSSIAEDGALARPGQSQLLYAPYTRSSTPADASAAAAAAAAAAGSGSGATPMIYTPTLFPSGAGAGGARRGAHWVLEYAFVGTEAAGMLQAAGAGAASSSLAPFDGGKGRGRGSTLKFLQSEMQPHLLSSYRVSSHGLHSLPPSPPRQEQGRSRHNSTSCFRTFLPPLHPSPYPPARHHLSSSATVEVVVPSMGESVSDGAIAALLKGPGDKVAVDDIIAQIETDKVTIDVRATEAGVIQRLAVHVGETVTPGTVVAIVSKDADAAATAAVGGGGEKEKAEGATPALPDAAAGAEADSGQAPVAAAAGVGGGGLATVLVPSLGESMTDGVIAEVLKKPGDEVAVDELLAQIETDKVTIDIRSTEAGILEQVTVAKGETVTPGTKVAVVRKGKAPTTPAPAAPVATAAEASPAQPTAPTPAPPLPKQAPTPPPPPPPSHALDNLLQTPGEAVAVPTKERERRVPMTRLRRRVAQRLKDSQNTFALLTTFNEVDMTNLMQMRNTFKDQFLEAHGIKLGFMSAFVKAAASALKREPVVNAVIDGDDIIYRDYVDISIAVGTPKGLVVPVIRSADELSFAGIEKAIAALGKKAKDGSISIDDMAGGTFTISNGGVYGSLISTPIINPPQSAILGMHTVQQRPMVVGKDILPRPMMYVALTYDHRLIDGREAVLFLRRIKDVVEDPRRLLLDL